jgi:hypothetical protein
MPDGKREIPRTIGRPALRAPRAAGLTTLQHVAKLPGEALQALHGVGPKAIRMLRELIKE